MIVRRLPLLALLAVGCDPDLPGKPSPKDRPVVETRVLAFGELFARNCAGCHGADGQFGPAPPLNDPLFRAIVPEDEVTNVVSRGRPGTPMPAFLRANGGSLTAVQVQMLVDGIKGIRREQVGPSGDVPTAAPLWGTANPAPAGVPPLVSADAGNVERGAKTFARACVTCHGLNGQGVERDGQLRLRIHDRAFLSLISDRELRRIVITGRPDLKMPSYAEKVGRPDDFQPLTAGDVADLVALVASWRTAQ
ncbi:MAG: c-type cytochrome [Gemmataceae bacterium]